MSSISQQNNFTTGQNVTATILNTEFSNIITNINNLYGFIDDSSGSAPITVDTGNTYVGIGTTSPSYLLHVYKTGTAQLYLEGSTGTILTLQGTAGNSGIEIVAGGGNTAYIDLRNDTVGDYDARISTDGVNLLSTTNVAPQTDNTVDLGTSGLRWDDVYATNGTIQTSDENDKESIEDSEFGLDFINQLRPVSYKWKKSYKIENKKVIEKSSNEKRKHIGLLAQEVETALNGTDFAGLIKDSETGKYGLRYNEFIPVLIKAVQELQEEVNSLKQK